MVINKHGSFYLRSGWGTKIIQAVEADEMIFSPVNERLAVDKIGLAYVKRETSFITPRTMIRDFIQILDVKKQNPDLVPYTALPDNEKEYDRIMAFNTIKLVKKLGYDIVKRNQ